MAKAEKEKVFSKEKVVMVETAKIKKAEWNYKTDNDEMAQKLTENIRRNGILQVSIIYEDFDGEYTVLDGNHRLDSYRELGVTEIPCINLGNISENEAKRIAIELNETQFPSDKIKLAETIGELSLEIPLEELELTLPFSMDELNNFQALLDMDWDETGGEVGEVTRHKREVKCPDCGNCFEV